MTPSENLRRHFYRGSPETIPFTFDAGVIHGFTKPILERYRLEAAAVRPEEHFDYYFRIVSLCCRHGGREGARAALPSRAVPPVKPGGSSSGEPTRR